MGLRTKLTRRRLSTTGQKQSSRKGKGHDELHKWLHPYMKLVSELEDVADEVEAQQILVNINKSFEMFNRYFQ